MKHENLENANKELGLQKLDKEARASELLLANIELEFQSGEKTKRANELKIANEELNFQINEKRKRAEELSNVNAELNYEIKNKKLQEKKFKKLQESSNIFKMSSKYSRSLIEAIKDPIFAISPLGIITDINEATINVTEATRVDLIDSLFCDYFTEINNAKKCLKKVYEIGYVFDFPLTIKDGKFTPVLLNGSVYKNDKGEVIGAVIVARDITERTVFEKQLIEAKENAEMATQIAENAVKAKQQFLSNMSHEIRTPMNAIIGFTKVVLKTELSDKQKEYLSAIKVSGDALIVLINDILDLAKVDAGKMQFEKSPFKLKASISSMLHLFEPKIQEKNLLLTRNYDEKIPSIITGDPVRLHQIILNLISNAVKFTSSGKISINVALINETEKNVSIEFSVKDTGIGISEEKLPLIFGNFQQATSGTSRLYGGSGLGLSIVKQLIEHQGGNIKVESKIGVGSTFTFVLQFDKTNINVIDEIEEKYAIDKSVKLKVLVVEDIKLNQLLMKTLLDDFGFEGDIASNGKIAIKKFKTNEYDMILMDLQMPEMNGFETTDYIRNVLKSNIPIIALTADVTTVDLEKCKAVGMNDYISKPVDERLLYNKMMSFVKNPIKRNNKSQYMLTQYESCIDLSYLNKRTKSNPELMMEMISLYIEQTPDLVKTMKKSLDDKDWKLLHCAAHKMIPSFSIMGINTNFEKMAIKVKEYADAQIHSEDIFTIVNELENVCNQACVELKLEFERIKNEK
jgi:PAS domain S-box-containing protein